MTLDDRTAALFADLFNPLVLCFTGSRLTCELWCPPTPRLVTMGDFARAAILPSLVAILVSLGGMDQQNNPGGDPSGQPPRHPPWTYEEIAERSAEVWEDNHWPSSWCSSHSGWDEVEQPAPVVTQPTQEQESSSSCSPLVTLPSQLPVEVSSSPQQLPLVEPTSAWDADISLSLQEQELEAWLHDPSAANLAPIPEDVPPPFGFTRWGVMSSQSSSTPQQEGPGVFAQSAASSSTSATCGASSSHSSGHDSFTLGGVDKASSSCESPPPFDVTTKEDVDPIAALRDLRPLRGRAPPAHNGHADAPRPPHGRDPSSLATPKACEMGTGITQRGSRLRSGIDRWHHPDGSIRYRLREQQALQETATLAQRTNLDQHPANDENPPHENANQNFSFYKDREWCQQGEPAPAQGKPSQETLLGPANQSTTADSSGNVGGDHHGSSVASSISSCSEVGFWKQGIWQPRQRTPAEARCHRGGGGPQRTLRKQARIQSYLQGTWKPAWLQRYIAEKDERTKNLVAETVNSGEVGGDPCPPETAETPPEPNPLTDVDPWSGQWDRLGTPRRGGLQPPGTPQHGMQHNGHNGHPGAGGGKLRRRLLRHLNRPFPRIMAYFLKFILFQVKTRVSRGLSNSVALNVAISRSRVFHRRHYRGLRTCSKVSKTISPRRTDRSPDGHWGDFVSVLMRLWIPCSLR